MPSPSNDSSTPDNSNPDDTSAENPKTPDNPHNAQNPETADPADPTDPAGPTDENGDDNTSDGESTTSKTDSLEDIRDGLDHAPGGLREIDPADQQALEDAVPRNEDGTPQRNPDPFGDWAQLQNDGGNEVPGRGNNCADCSRAFLETWYGNPQVSAPRTLDPGADGKIDLLAPEDNANENQIGWSGAPHVYAGKGDDPSTAQRIESDLLQAGPGSAAIVQVDWPGGGGHAFNAVNHEGKIVWVDTQTGEVSHDPIHIQNAKHAWHISLDPDGNPLHPATPEAKGDESNDQQNNGDPQNAPNSQGPQHTTADEAQTQYSNESQQSDQSQQPHPETGPGTDPDATSNDPAGDKPDTDATATPPSPDGTTPDQEPSPDRDTPQESTPDSDSTPDTTQQSTPESESDSDSGSARDATPESKPGSDPRTSPSIPHQQTDTDPRADDPSDPRAQDPRTIDPRADDPRATDSRTADPREDHETRPTDDGLSGDHRPQDPNPSDDRTPTPDDAPSGTQPDAQPDSTPANSPYDPSETATTDTPDTKPAQLNTDSNIPSRESLPQGKNAEATRHIEDATQHRKPLYGDIAPAHAAPPDSDRPTGPAEPSGTTDDPDERARQRAGDEQKLDRANSDKAEDQKWFKKYYNINGHRIRIATLCDDGFPAPQLHPADPPNRWMLASDTPEPESESYTDWTPDQRDKTQLSDENRQRLDQAAEDRQRAIDEDRQPHKDRRAAKEAYERDKTPENEQKFQEASEKHTPLHGRMGQASENYGDTVAELHAMPDNFPDAERVDDEARGNNRFDQIWINPGEPPELIVVEAKGSTDAGLGERRGLPDQAPGRPDTSGDAGQQDSDGASTADDQAADSDGSQDAQDEPRSSVPRVKQGTRAYFEAILHEMDERAERNLKNAENAESDAESEKQARAAEKEADLADQLRTALDEGRVRYVLVIGKPDGMEHGSYEMKEFDIRNDKEKRDDDSSPS